MTVFLQDWWRSIQHHVGGDQFSITLTGHQILQRFFYLARLRENPVGVNKATGMPVSSRQLCVYICSLFLHIYLA
jgi:hypothetical protein